MAVNSPAFLLDDSSAKPGEVRRLRVEGGLVYYGAGRFQDDRGFYEEIDVRSSASGVTAEDVVQQSGFSVSNCNVIRGIHCSPYGKNVICTSGELWDCMVDLRPDSPTFMKWDAVLLSPERKARMYIPPHVGHGFMALKDGSACLYLKHGKFDKSLEVEVNAMDPAIGIQWPKPVGEAAQHIISAKDQSLPSVAEALAARSAGAQPLPAVPASIVCPETSAVKRKLCPDDDPHGTKQRCS